ncbi:MAG TPA: UDP-N-acetylenolpyruvoylglucosamine reductase [Erysipelotrichaceae bacterium]|nr:UDP-N-acetylenolpyruvoylglucosamine reductase [Erysipelotrichaceae bacterium]
MDRYAKYQIYGEIKYQASLKKYTSLRVGGTVDALIYPHDLNSLLGLLKDLHEDSIPFKIWGMGSNILASDDHYQGLVVKLDLCLKSVVFQGNKIYVQAGVSLIALAYLAADNALSGFEFASGIPGSVGGALFMNAGAYKHDVYECLDKILVYRDDRVEWIEKNEIEVKYRYTSFMNHRDWIILEAVFNCNDADKDRVLHTMDERRQRRIASQPLDLPSAGSVFRNPETMSAWSCIDAVGLRGYRIGGAMFSEKHSNFIVNNEDAKAKDVMDLIYLAQNKVEEMFNIRLKPEIEFFNWSNHD